MSILDSSLDRRLIEVQRRIASRVVLEDRFSDEVVAGVDQAFLDDLVISGAVVLGPEGDVRSRACHTIKAAIPYVPGFLSFREGPAAIKAVRALDQMPTLLFVDGCGINHPRMAGLATYIGVILDMTFRGKTLVNVRFHPYVMILSARAALTEPEGDGHYVLERIWKASQIDY